MVVVLATAITLSVFRDGGSGSAGSGASEESSGLALGREARVGAHTALVTTAAVVTDPGSGGNYLVVDVALSNEGDEGLSYNGDEWQLRTPAGEVHQVSRRPSRLPRGELAPGERVEGQISFPINTETSGDFEVEYLGLADDPGAASWTAPIATAEGGA